MKKLSRTEGQGLFAGKLALIGIVITFGIYLALLNSFSLATLGIFLLGAMMAHAVELQHQCIHNNGFESKQLNRLFGFLLGLPMLTSFQAYRRRHLIHHRYLGTKDDSAFFSYDSSYSLTWKSIIKDAYGFKYYKDIVYQVFHSLQEAAFNATKRNMETLDQLIICMLLISAVLVSLACQSLVVVKIWLIPLIFVARPIHFLVELPEHVFCARRISDVFQNTRTIRGSWFSQWFTNGNNFHVEHHLFPNLFPEDLEKASKFCIGKHHHIYSS